VRVSWKSRFAGVSQGRGAESEMTLAKSRDVSAIATGVAARSFMARQRTTMRVHTNSCVFAGASVEAGKARPAGAGQGRGTTGWQHTHGWPHAQ
jgi:hypothetical protein